MTTRTLVFLSLALLIPAAADVRAAEDVPDMIVLAAQVRTRAPGRKPGDSLKLEALFRPSSVPGDWDAATDGVMVRILDRTVISFPPTDDRAGFSERGFRSIFYREKSSRSRIGVRKLRLDAVEGRFTLVAKRLNLSSLSDALDDDLSVELVLGEMTYRASIKLARRGRSHLFQSPVSELPKPPTPAPGHPTTPPGTLPPDPGTGGGGGLPPGTLSFRVLDQGDFSNLTASQSRVVRDDASWQALWSQHTGATKPALPAVDFTKEIVVGLFLGGRPSTGYRADVLSIAAQGSGALVTWEETRRIGSNCFTAQVITAPFVIVAITKVSGAVSLSGSVRVLNCP